MVNKENIDLNKLADNILDKGNINKANINNYQHDYNINEEQNIKNYIIGKSLYDPDKLDGEACKSMEMGPKIWICKWID